MSSTMTNTTGMPRPPARARYQATVEATPASAGADVLALWAWWVLATAASTLISGVGALLLTYAILDAPAAAPAATVPVVFAAAALPLGLAQKLVMGGRFVRGWRWVASWLLAAGAVGLLSLAIRPDWGAAAHLTVMGALLGATAGALQWVLVLRFERGRTWLWVPFGALGWGVAGALALGAGVLSGAAAGAITGLPIGWWLSEAGAGRTAKVGPADVRR